MKRGTELYIGALVAGNYNESNDDMKIIVADFGDYGATSYVQTLCEGDVSYTISYSDATEFVDAAKGINGALIFSADSVSLWDSACALNIKGTTYDLAGLQELMSDNDYLSFYVKLTSRNTVDVVSLEIGWGTVIVNLSNEWQEVRVSKAQLEDLFLLVNDDGVDCKGMIIRLCNNSDGATYTIIDGVELAISSVILNSGDIAFPDRVADTLVYANEYGATEQLSSSTSTLTVDTAITYDGQASSIKLSKASTPDEDLQILTIASSYIKDVLDKYDEIWIPMYNAHVTPDPADCQTFLCSGGDWGDMVILQGGEWTLVKIKTAEWSGRRNEAGEAVDDIDGLAFYMFSYYSNIPCTVYIGNIIGYNEPPRYIDALDLVDCSTADVLSDVTAGDGVALTFDAEKGIVVTLTASQADNCFGISTPNTSAEGFNAKAYRHVAITVTNPNAFDVWVSTFWLGDTKLEAGETKTIKLSVDEILESAVPFDGSDGKITNTFEKFGIRFTAIDWATAMPIGTTFYVSSIQLVGDKQVLPHDVVDLSTAASLDAFADTGIDSTVGDKLSLTYVEDKGIKATFTSAGAEGDFGLIAPNVEGINLADYNYLAVTVENPMDFNIMFGTAWFGDTVISAGETVTVKLNLAKLLLEGCAYNNYGNIIDSDLTNFTGRLIAAVWGDTIAADSYFYITSIQVIK